MTVVRIVADDLTGALDTAAPLVAMTGALPVFWDLARARNVGGSFALDTETRDADRPREDWLEAFGGADLAFKKIDSLLRGHTADEIAACLRSGRFASAVIAPAFPGQQRVTRDGRQYWRAAADEPWTPVDGDLLAELTGRGVPIRQASSAGALAEGGFLLCDAQTDDDLRAIVAAGGRLAPPVLWCGTAGLAHAFAAPLPAPRPPPPERPLLMLIGSPHSVSRAQVRALAAHRPALAVRLSQVMPAAIEAALDAVGRVMAEHEVAALVLALPEGTPPDAAANALGTIGRALPARPAPRSLVVTGGDTLVRLMEALSAESLLARGELLPGVPCSEIQGGVWPGTQVVSKSGAFGDPRLLIRLADWAKGERHD